MAPTTGQDRTEKPTEKRKHEARKKGQVAISADLRSASLLLSGLILLLLIGASILSGLEQLMVRGLTLQMTTGFSTMTIRDLAGAIFTLVGWPFLTFGVSLMVAMVATHAAQTRLRFSLTQLRPNFKRLNPVLGFKRFLSPTIPVSLAKDLAKLVAVGGVAFMTIQSRWHSILALLGASPPQLLATVTSLVINIGLRVGAAMLVIGLIDYLWQRRRTTKSLMMTKQEVKDETKQYEMPATMRREIRKKQKEFAMQRMFEAVPTADVVITNPVHLACALKYDRSGNKDRAPRLVAKGRDLVAEQIKDIARKHDVEIIENPPLAQMLYRKVDLNREIPEELYAAVVEILAVIYRRQGWRF